MQCAAYVYWCECISIFLNLSIQFAKKTSTIIVSIKEENINKKVLSKKTFFPSSLTSLILEIRKPLSKFECCACRLMYKTISFI
jgi:hypothetical protein